MIRNFLVVTLRNLRRNYLYSIINIAGLAIGIACSVLILVWVADETSFDSFHPKAERLYQVWVNGEFDGKINSWNSAPLPAYEALKSADANIVNTAVTGWGWDHLLTVGESRLVKRGYFASEEFLEMFEFPLIEGDAATSLDDPSSIVITESLAQALFPDQDPMNQFIRMDDKSSLKVTGILEDVPGNSSFQFEYLIPWKHREAINPWVVENKTNWGNYSFQVFVELSAAAKEADAENAIRDMLTEHGETDFPKELFLHPLLRWRLHSYFEDGKEAGGTSDYVQLFSVIALFILVIACINFMNLATARSERRAREIGIRKTLGSNRHQLIFQFISESVLISVLAFLAAIALAQMALPAYNTLVEKQLIIDYSSLKFWTFSILMIIGTGIVSGSYPAFYLSSFRPVKTLKGSVATGKGGSIPRKALVVLQFGFSILLLISTAVIFQQIQLIQNRQLGYDQENLITINYTEEIARKYEVLKNDLLQSGVVESVTRSNSPITAIHSNNFLGWPGKPESLKVLFTTVATDYDYAKTMGIDVLMGRDFSKEFVTDTGAIVINRAALDLMKLTDPVGTRLDLWERKRELIGVVDNVIMGSPYQEVKPMFMILDTGWINYVTVRLKKTEDLPSSLSTVEGYFNQHNSAYPFEFKFADDEFQKKFTTINMTRKLSGLFSLLAIFITGLGLFGLASFTAEQRIKEIGIRQVLGATVGNLMALLSQDFARLVVLAFFLAAPTAWYLLNQYLMRYPIRVDIAWWIFPLAGFAALTFALIIVSSQARRAALSNPVNSLRNE